MVLVYQIDLFMENKMFDRLCRFRKGYIAQYTHVDLIEKWEKCLDKYEIVDTIILDLYKAFNCLPHELLAAKLEAYGSSGNVLKLMNNYLSNRMLRVKIESNYSTWKDIVRGVPQCSVLGSIFFTILINHIFLFIGDIRTFADDNTLYACDVDIDKAIHKLEDDLKLTLRYLRYIA